MDDVEDYLGTARVTSRVGADLRAARERLGWTLPAIAAYLRIRLPFLEAIEDGRLGDLPGNAYAVGFLRTYAQALGLDPDEIARRFKAEAADVNRKTELAFPAPVPERGIPAGAVVLVGVVIAIGAYIGWYRMSGTDTPTSDMVQAVPERLAPLAATAAPAPPTPSVPATPSPSAAVAPTAIASTSPAVPAAASVGSGSGGTALAPPSVGALTMGPPLPPTIAATLAPAPSQTAGAGLPAPNVPMPPVPIGTSLPAVVLPGLPEGPRIVLRAKADAWVQVREKQGTVLLNRVMRNGETWPVPQDRQTLLLTTGNAAGTELIVDGVVMPSLGGDGAVRRDLPLDPETLRDGRLGALAPSSPSPAKPSTTAAGTSAIRTN
jgi:cytoskeleton protein RodZ